MSNMCTNNHMITYSSHSDVKYYDNAHLKSSKKKLCMICKKKTDRLDIFSESYICSEECDKEFYKMVASHEQCDDF